MSTFKAQGVKVMQEVAPFKWHQVARCRNDVDAQAEADRRNAEEAAKAEIPGAASAIVDTTGVVPEAPQAKPRRQKRAVQG